jgi:hypothetical protein
LAKPVSKPKNQFKRAAKFDESRLIRLVYCFCQGISGKITARNTGLSLKSVRRHFLDLRKRLLKPAFNRWHGTNRKLLSVALPEVEDTIRRSYFAFFAACAGHETCARNFRLGNRKKRQCRTCPLGAVYSDERRAEAYTVIDTIHEFYETLGIRGAVAENKLQDFQERLVHTTAIATVRNHSRKLPNGFFDPAEKSFLSGGALMDALLNDLANDPLDARRWEVKIDPDMNK